jgi:hypothetical protein
MHALVNVSWQAMEAPTHAKRTFHLGIRESSPAQRTRMTIPMAAVPIDRTPTEGSTTMERPESTQSLIQLLSEQVSFAPLHGMID